MKRSSQAVTLVELIITSIIVSMVVAGVFSADYALRRMSKMSASNSQLGVSARAVTDRIRSMVRSVHDDLTTAIDHSIIIPWAGTYCFRHDIDPGTGFTPDDYADDKWTCLTLKDNTKLYSCERLNPHPCDQVIVGDPTVQVFVGEVVSDQFTKAAIMPVVTKNAGTGEYSFEMSVVVRQDPSAGAACNPAACGAGAIPTNGTAANPQAVIKFRESPAGF